MTTPPLAVAVALSVALAWRVRRPRQWAVAETLAALLCVNLWRPVLRPWITWDLAAFVAWYAVTAAGAWGVLKGARPSRSQTSDASPGFRLTPDGVTADRSAAIVRAAWILLPLACLASSILAVRLDRIAELSRAAFALALALQLLAAVRFASRGVKPDDAQRVALILALSSFVDAFGPWLVGDPSKDWQLGRAISVVTFSIIAGVQAWNLRRRIA